MLRMNPKASPEAAKTYFVWALARQDYYTQDQEVVGRWGGLAAERLGLSGTVDQERYDALCDNLHPVTGGRLTPRTKANRTVGYDLTFNAPKSVSLLYAWTGDQRIVDAFSEAVAETMAELEAEAQTRVRVGGADEDRVTGNLVWATFVHHTTRPVDGVPDPHLHAHCFVFNATYDPAEQRWKAGQFRGIKEGTPYYEAAALDRFALKLKALGYPVERKEKAFEICGVLQSLIDKFSRRTALIERVAKARGITDPEAKARLGAATREAKRQDLSMADLRRLWADRMSPGERQVVQALLAEVRARQPDRVPGLSSPPPTSTPAGREPTGAEVKAVEYAIRHGFERHSAVDERWLLEAALRFGMGEVTPEGVRAALLARPDVLRARHQGRWKVTTQQVRAEEQAMVDWVRRTRGTVAPIVATADDYAFRDEQLNDQQRAAVRHVLGSRDRVTTVIGKSGTGKTRLIREAVAAMEARGHKVIVLAPGSETARDTLPKEGLARTDTVARFLIDPAAHWDCRGGVWWVDEAGLLSSPALSRLCTLAQEWDARLVLSGDPMQHRAVERGDALAILQRHAGLEAVTVGRILRQSGLHREAVEHFSEGRMAQGFERLDALGAIVEVEDEGERHRLLAQDYLRAVRERATALVVSPTHAEGRKVTDLIRQALRDEGRLAGEEREVLRLRRIDLTAGQRGDAQLYRQGWVLEATQHMPGWAAGERLTVAGVRDGVLHLRNRYGEAQTFEPTAGWAERFQAYESETVQLAVGDRVRVTKNGRSVDRRNKLSNGTIHTLVGFTESGDLRLDNGVVLADNFGHLTHGYATTSHSAQSKTVDRVFVAEGTESFLAASREQFYVSVGRGSKLVRVYTDNREGLLEAVHASSRRAAALDLVPAAERDDESEREAGARQGHKEPAGQRQKAPSPAPPPLPPRTSDRLKSPPRSPSSRQVETLRGYLPELPEPDAPERDGPDMDL